MARRKLGLGGPIKPSEVVERVQVDRASDRRLSDDEKDFDLDVHLHDDQEDKSTLPRRPHAPTGEAKDVLDALGDDALESLTTNLTGERPWLGELPPEMASGPTVGAPAETVEKLRPDQLSPPAGPAPPPTSQPPIAGLPPAASQDLPPSPPTSALELPSEMATGPTVGAPAETVEKLRPDQLSPPAGPAPPPTSQPPIAGLPPAAATTTPSPDDKTSRRVPRLRRLNCLLRWQPARQSAAIALIFRRRTRQHYPRLRIRTCRLALSQRNPSRSAGFRQSIRRLARLHSQQTPWRAAPRPLQPTTQRSLSATVSGIG